MARNDAGKIFAVVVPEQLGFRHTTGIRPSAETVMMQFLDSHTGDRRPVIDHQFLEYALKMFVHRCSADSQNDRQFLVGFAQAITVTLPA